MNVHPATLDWILEPLNPSVRLIALRHLFRRPNTDADVRETQARVMRSPWVTKLMRSQHADGWWVNPKNCYHPRGSATVWHLQLLAELGVRGGDPRIDRACERFLLQNGMPDGGFACGVHPKRYSEECLTGHMLYTLIVFGRAKDPRTVAARAWVLDRQLPDGGWNCRPNQSHSSFVSSLGAVKALAASGKRANAEPLKRAVDFLVDHRLFFSHTTGKPIRAFWPAPIQFPAHYRHDLLHALRALVLARATFDPRLDAALDALEERADSRGRWRIDVAPALRVEPEGRPSKWVTAWALSVLRHFGRLSLGVHPVS
jgi:hypothetical protein